MIEKNLIKVKIVVILEKCKIELENGETMEDYGYSDFKAIYGDYQFRECMKALERI